MKFLNLDDEQAAMMVDAAALSVAFLTHRSRRIDPDGLLSKAAELQAHKLENIQAQLSEPEIRSWADIDPADQAAIRQAAEGLLRSNDAREYAFTWRALLAAVISARPSAASRQEPSPDET